MAIYPLTQTVPTPYAAHFQIVSAHYQRSPNGLFARWPIVLRPIVFTPEALRHLIAETGPQQIMVGTDYPFPWTSTELDLVLDTPGLSDDDRNATLGGTAAQCWESSNWGSNLINDPSFSIE